MSLYKYVSFNNLKYLLDGSIRFTQPKAFNDPFELLPEIHLTGSIDGIEFDIQKPIREPLLARLPDEFESEFCNDITTRHILADLSKKIGILCLSENPNSLLMWSHYSDQYKGAVVEFDETHEFFTGRIPVNYEENRPKLDYEKLIDENEQMRVSELCYKPIEWKYENESRIIRSLSDCKKSGHFDGFDVYVMDIPADCIKSVVLGERMSIESQRYVISKVAETNISVSLSAISNFGYGFRDEKIKLNVPFSQMPPLMSPRTAHIFKDLSGSQGETARWMIQNHPMSKVVNVTA